MADDRAELEQAITDMRFARKTHADWADWLEQNPAQAKEPDTRVLEDVVGAVADQREWVVKYDRVIALLEGNA